MVAVAVVVAAVVAVTIGSIVVVGAALLSFLAH